MRDDAGVIEADKMDFEGEGEVVAGLVFLLPLRPYLIMNIIVWNC